ncbi:MAG: hypothetical protein PHY92_04755 [Alphaproteobacteria bacterium]|nr:hypothetical protein [Alphaproteobacteria bacterium]
MKKLFILMCAALTLAACAEKWQKPNASGQEFEAAYYNCMDHANARFPSRMRGVTNDKLFGPPLKQTHCDRNPSVFCVPVKCDYVFPPVTPYCDLFPTLDSMDNREDARQSDFRACMSENGWRRL